MSSGVFSSKNLTADIEGLLKSEVKKASKIVSVGTIITIFISLIGFLISALLIINFERNIINLLIATIIFIAFTFPLFLITLLILSIKGRFRINRWLESKILKTLELSCELIYGIFGKKLVNMQESFVHLNNTSVLLRVKPTKSEDILILLPHCLQGEDCIHRITKSIELCQKCGKCLFSRIRSMVENKYKASVVPGGSIAREVVIQVKPKLVIAVACERDMTSGILDTLPLPVYGVLIDKPFGYCKKTVLNLNKLLEALFLFTENINEIVTDEMQVVRSN